MSSADSSGRRDSKTRIGPRSGKPKTLQITPSISMCQVTGELGDWAQLLFSDGVVGCAKDRELCLR